MLVLRLALVALLALAMPASAMRESCSPRGDGSSIGKEGCAPATSLVAEGFELADDSPEDAMLHRALPERVACPRADNGMSARVGSAGPAWGAFVQRNPPLLI